MNVLCCQVSQTTKDAVRVTGRSHDHAMSITQSLMQACRSTYSVYKTQRTREEKEKKVKGQRLKDQVKRYAKGQQEAIRCLWRGRSESWRTEKIRQ